MSDIYAELRVAVADVEPYRYDDILELCDRAADEIERLSTENAELRKLLAECQEYVSDAHAAQLREAKGYDLHAERAARMIARALDIKTTLDRIDAALGEKP